MLAPSSPAGKGGRCPFAAPPWDRTSPEWRQIGRELPDDHLARQVDRGVARLDLAALRRSYAGRGSRACPPDRLLRVALFELRRGRASPAAWHRDALENRAVRWLARGVRPARSVWYAFAARIRPRLDEWNRAVLHQARAAGAVAGARAALDGTAVEANASRHRLLAAAAVARRLQALAAPATAEGGPAAGAPAWMAKTPAGRRRQAGRYEQAARALAGRRDADRAVVSAADPEAAVGRDKLRVFRPLYNVQLVRDLDSPFVLGYATFARASDAGALAPLVGRAEQLAGRRPAVLLADSGYVTGLDLADARRLGVTLCGPWKANDYSRPAAARQWPKERFTWDAGRGEYRCPRGQALPLVGVQARRRSLGRTERLELYRADAAACAACPAKADCCPKSRSGRNLMRGEHEPLIEEHRRAMATPEAQALYRLRARTVEPSFGDAKQHRGFRRMSGRGLLAAAAQTALTVLAHNLMAFVKAVAGAKPGQDTT